MSGVRIRRAGRPSFVNPWSVSPWSRTRQDECMPQVATHASLEALLQHPALWRGRGAAAPAGLSTGFAALDAALPGGGWPRQGLIEIITTGGGHGELTLWMPLIRQLTSTETPRCCA